MVGSWEIIAEEMNEIGNRKRNVSSWSVTTRTVTLPGNIYMMSSPDWWIIPTLQKKTSCWCKTSLELADVSFVLGIGFSDINTFLQNAVNAATRWGTADLRAGENSANPGKTIYQKRHLAKPAA